MAFYFAPEIDELNCHSLENIKDMMRFDEIEQTEIIEAKRDTGHGYFFCKHFGEIGEVGESCGKLCSAYRPRNGKSGRCVHSGYCYSQTDKKRILSIEKT